MVAKFSKMREKSRNKKLNYTGCCSVDAMRKLLSEDEEEANTAYTGNMRM